MQHASRSLRLNVSVFLAFPSALYRLLVEVTDTMIPPCLWKAGYGFFIDHLLVDLFNKDSQVLIGL